MSLLTETENWLESEKPDRDEIILTIDNLSHEFGRASPDRRLELSQCIALLCTQVGLEPAKVNLESNALGQAVELDASPLGDQVTDSWEEMPADAKAKKFAELKDLLTRPF